MKRSWTRIVVFIIFALALFIRLQYISTTIIPKPIVADAQQYIVYGHNLITHGIYSKDYSENPTPDSFRSPGYPFFIALAYYTGGEKDYFPFVIYVQVILSSLLVPLTYYLGTFFMRSFYAVLSAIFVALSPHLVSVPSYFLTETFFSFFLMASLSCTALAMQKKSAVLFVLSALLFGYTYLINETSLFIPLILLVVAFYVLWKKSKKYWNKKLVINLVIFLFIYALFPVGWTIRNNISLSPAAPTGSSRLISTLSHGAYPDFIYENPEFKYFPYKEDPMQPEFGSSFQSFKKILWSRVKKDPFGYITWYFLKKPYWLWSWNILQGQGDVYIYPVTESLYTSSYLANATRIVMKVTHPLLLILALAGPLFLFRDGRRIHTYEVQVNMQMLPFVICIYFTVIYTITAPWPRYSIPLRPELYLCSMWSLMMLCERFARKKHSSHLIKNK